MSFHIPRSSMTTRRRLTLSYVLCTAVMGLVLTLVVYLLLLLSPAKMEVVFPGDGLIVAHIPIPHEMLNVVLMTSLGVLVVVTTLAGVVGWFVSGRIMRPLVGIRDATHTIAAGHMDQRLSMDGPEDELNDLVDSFNAMLDSLSDIFNAQQRFSASVSHELLTPIATIQTIVDVALADPTVHNREVLENIRRINAGNARTVTALLNLAEAQTGAVELEVLDLGEHLHQAWMGLREEAEAAEISYQVSVAGTPAWVRGHPVLLDRALSNLLRNAIRHNHPGGCITAELSTQGQRHVLTIANSGQVLEPSRVETLCEPFVRSAGLVDKRGHGLGLSIVQAVIKGMRGQLKLSPREGGGLVVEVSWPAVGDPVGGRRM